MYLKVIFWHYCIFYEKPFRSSWEFLHHHYAKTMDMLLSTCDFDGMLETNVLHPHFHIVRSHSLFQNHHAMIRIMMMIIFESVAHQFRMGYAFELRHSSIMESPCFLMMLHAA